MVAILAGCATGESSRDSTAHAASPATVTLYLVPEGAGTSAAASVRLGRDALRDRNAWRITSAEQPRLVAAMYDQWEW